MTKKSEALEALERLYENEYPNVATPMVGARADYKTVKAALEELESIKDNLISKRASIQPNWFIREIQEENTKLKAEIARLNALLDEQKELVKAALKENQELIKYVKDLEKEGNYWVDKLAEKEVEINQLKASAAYKTFVEQQAELEQLKNSYEAHQINSEIQIGENRHLHSEIVRLNALLDEDRLQIILMDTICEQICGEKCHENEANLDKLEVCFKKTIGKVKGASK